MFDRLASPDAERPSRPGWPTDMSLAISDSPTTSAVALHRAPAPGSAPQGGAPGRGAAGVPAPSGPRGWRLWRALLGAPLTAKLVGANGLVALAAIVALARASTPAPDVRIAAVALVIALGINLLLVRLALRPVWELERVATRVWKGDFAARVPATVLADGDMQRVGRTINLLLDALADDRQRLRALALQAVRAQDDERSRIARELHDSTAQTIAALGWQLAAVARDAEDPAVRERVLALREQAGALLEEVRALSHAIHPRVLDDLGLVPALEWLSRQTREHAGLEVDVADRLDAEAERMSDVTAATLYRVAQESLRNVERHADARSAHVELRPLGEDVLLEITDDGRGFDLAEAERRRPGMGLFSMRERVALVGGTLEIDTAPGRGTRVVARAPLAFVGPTGGPARPLPFMPPTPASGLR